VFETSVFLLASGCFTHMVFREEKA
jgi:hypothetical protein